MGDNMAMPVNTPERFWLNVDKNGPVHQRLGTRCWLWLGKPLRGRNGVPMYGRTVFDRVQTLAHRKAWELLHGDAGCMWVLHHCDTPLCVNAETHLFLGTAQDNVRDRQAKGRGASGDIADTTNWKRGDEHWTRLHPERVVSGELHGATKFSAAIKREIVLDAFDGESIASLCKRYGASKTHIRRLIVSLGATLRAEMSYNPSIRSNSEHG